MATDPFAEALNAIKTHEIDGKRVCKVKNSTLLTDVLTVIARYGYIKGFEVVDNGRFKEVVIHLLGRINNSGVIKPRFPVKFDNIHEYERKFIPSVDFGILLVSTSQGVMSNREARDKRLGGRLVAYIY